MKTAKLSLGGADGRLCSSWLAGRLTEPLDDSAAAHQAVARYAVYHRHEKTAVIESPQDFLVTGIARIVNSAAQTFSSRGDGISQLVNVAIEIAEESYVALPREECIDHYLDNVAECAIQFARAASVKEERTAVLRLGNALDEYGAVVNIFYGDIAQTANLKLRVLSRLLLVNSMRPILDNSNKNAEIDFHRLGRVNIHRQR
jgi:hypothetical protein